MQPLGTSLSSKIIHYRLGGARKVGLAKRTADSFCVGTRIICVPTTANDSHTAT